MKRIFGLVALGFITIAASHAQLFDSGSDGSDGALVVDADTTMDLPEDGIFNFTTVDIAQGATLSFNRNELNTPVYLLASGDINVQGTIEVDGGNGSSLAAGLGGPGGFDGGLPGIAGGDPGDGMGPGGGKMINDTNCGSCSTSGGGGSFGTRTTSCIDERDGEIYGSPLLVPLIGGSGGGGNANFGGAGGGGALLLASSTRITINGSLSARGGNNAACLNEGSGGGIRLISPIVTGTGTVTVARQSFAGAGRMRVDTIDRTQLTPTFSPVDTLSVGSFMSVFPDTVPRLDLVHVAGTDLPEGSGAVELILPLNAPTSQLVRLQARDFVGQVPVRVVVTPDSGSSTSYDATIDADANNPATVDINVDIPANVTVSISAWTRDQ